MINQPPARYMNAKALSKAIEKLRSKTPNKTQNSSYLGKGKSVPKNNQNKSGVKTEDYYAQIKKDLRGY